MKYIDLFKKIDDHFLSDDALARVCVFVNEERQVEGWFKGELLLLFNRLRNEGLIGEWQSEYKPNDSSQSRVDFFIHLDDGPLYLELKAFYHGKQGDTKIDLGTCFSFLPNDVCKLADIPEGNKFIMIFVTPNKEDWETALNKFTKKFPFVSEIPTRGNYPHEIFIAKLKTA